MTGSSDTTEEPRVIGIHGAREQYEIARCALTQALRGAASTGAATDLLDLSDLTFPWYNPDHPEAGDAVVVRRCVSRADAVLLATAARHDSYSAQLKNALEYCDGDEFDGKPVGLLGVDNTDPATALKHLRTICTTLNARVLPLQVSIETTEEHNELPTDSVTELRMLGQQIIDRLHTRPDG
jgi:NAD(P)H-dependent FMN reductase